MFCRALREQPGTNIAQPPVITAEPPTSVKVPPLTPDTTATTGTANTLWRQGSIRAEAGFNFVRDQDFELWFKITNEGSSDFIARLRIEDFSVMDDTGKAYVSGSDAGPRTTTVKVNNSATYSLYFKGSLNPKAKKLILRLAQLSGTSDISITIPLGSDVSSLRNEVGFNFVRDQDFELWFKITNEGSSDFIARLRIEDFSVMDDTGKAYVSGSDAGPRTTTVKVNNSATYSLYFKGSLNPKAKKLILRLAQLSGTSDISITIPLGSDVSSLRNEAGFNFVRDQDFELWFKITNEGSSDFIARLRIEDFSVVDDTGKAYVFGSDAGPRTTTVKVNNSVTYSLYFKGSLNPKAKKLILRLAQLSGTSDISITIPLGSDVSSLRNEAGFNFVRDQDFELWFKITNEGSSDFIARLRIEDFSVVDDTGKAYVSGSDAGPRTTTVKVNNSVTYSLYFKGSLNPKAKKLILRLAQLSGTSDISIIIPIEK